MLRERLAKLPPEKRAAFEKLLAKKATGAVVGTPKDATSLAEAGPIARVDRAAELPLSFAQQRQWFLHRLDPRSSTYHLPSTVLLEGPLQIAALAAALRALVARHEPLRTCFPEASGQPRQGVAAAVDLPLPVVDLSCGCLSFCDLIFQRHLPSRVIIFQQNSISLLFGILVLGLLQLSYGLRFSCT